jgi:hypothetical protein
MVPLGLVEPEASKVTGPPVLAADCPDAPGLHVNDAVGAWSGTMAMFAGPSASGMATVGAPVVVEKP